MVSAAQSEARHLIGRHGRTDSLEIPSGKIRGWRKKRKGGGRGRGDKDGIRKLTFQEER